MGQAILALVAAVRRGVHDNAGAVASEHAAHQRGDCYSLHPVKGLGERDEIDFAEVGGEVLTTHLPPVYVANLATTASGAGFLDHGSIGIDARDVREIGGRAAA